MTATVIVNKLTVVHKDSGGTCVVFPDVCLTPAPGGPVPVPYPNTARSRHTQDGSRSVRVDGNPIMLKSSCFSTSTGDEAGSAGGVASGVAQGKAYPKMYSFDVKVEGENVFRFSDVMLQNGGSPTNTGPAAEVQPNRPARAAASAKRKKRRAKKRWKVVSMQWAPPAACCCGDEALLLVKAKRGTGKAALSAQARRSGAPAAVVGRFRAKLKSSRAKVKWIARRGPYLDVVTLAALQKGLAGKRASTNTLEVRTVPPAAREQIGPFQRDAPRFVEVVVDGVPTWQQVTPGYGWQVGYDIEIRGGELVVTHRLEFDLQEGAAVDADEQRAWKADIERIWDRRFRVHRANCKRRDDCDCSSRNGCCSFTVRIQCEYGTGHGTPIRLFPGAAQGPWGSASWWYSNQWYEQLSPNIPDTVRAHEFGHRIGMYDEYPEGACDPERRVTDDPTSLMGGGETIHARHLVEFHAWFTQRAAGIIGPTTLLELER